MILALDLGSTCCKGAIFAADGQALAEASVDWSYDCRAGGVVEFSVAQAEQVFKKVIAQLMAAAGGTDLRALSLTSQAQTFCLWQGEPLTPFLSWQDSRPAASLAELSAALPDEAMGEHTSFSALCAQHASAKAWWLSRQKPELWARRGRVVHLPEYLAFLLSGEFCLDRNLAAMSGFYSLAQRGWWDEALRTLDLAEVQLPDLVDVGTIALTTSATAEAFGLPVDLPVIFAGNDQTAGAYGAGIHESNAALVTLGTAQVVYAISADLPSAQPGIIRGVYPSCPTCPAGAGYRMVADSCGGNLASWAIRTLRYDSGDREAFFQDAARIPMGCDGLVFEGDPTADAGAWRGLGLHHTPAHLARAVLEYLCRRLDGHLETLGHDGDLLVAGGGARSTIWPDMIAQICGRSLKRVSASPLDGAAAMARAVLDR